MRVSHVYICSVTALKKQFSGGEVGRTPLLCSGVKQSFAVHSVTGLAWLGGVARYWDFSHMVEQAGQSIDLTCWTRPGLAICLNLPSAGLS